LPPGFEEYSFVTSVPPPLGTSFQVETNCSIRTASASSRRYLGSETIVRVIVPLVSLVTLQRATQSRSLTGQGALNTICTINSVLLKRATTRDFLHRGNHVS